MDEQIKRLELTLNNLKQRKIVLDEYMGSIHVNDSKIGKNTLKKELRDISKEIRNIANTL